ncbi:MAG: response regulator transcription factor [Bacteroidota bacterium]
MKILIIEDEPALSSSIAAYLKAEKFHCETADDLQTAASKVHAFDYDCILLDISLPDGNGLQLLKELKLNGKTDGVIIISAKSSLEEKINGLQLGADDYIAKPFYLSELSARIAAVIRRRKFNGAETLVLNELSINFAAKTAYVLGKPVYLTRTEYDLLLYMVVNKNRVLSKNALAACLSDIVTGGFNEFIYSHIKNLKKKLTAAGCSDYIKTMYGTGYKFEIDT